ncbi:MAG: hypothetical protein OEZ68_11295 [Gammaproteobacteria bacterium]|nr:hypothetical protein [Gammaproteobacteria bacterium]MDH5801378.1 hypothetical protein [Gammaproteobacteria bacterium]
MSIMTAFALASVVTWVVGSAANDVFSTGITTFICFVVFFAVFFYTDRFLRDLRG